jgi:hypothetical protein
MADILKPPHDGVVLECHRRYLFAYLKPADVPGRVRVQAFGLPDGNRWEVRPCELTDEQRKLAVSKVRAAMVQEGIDLPRLSREEAAVVGRSMPRPAANDPRRERRVGN